MSVRSSMHRSQKVLVLILLAATFVALASTNLIMNFDRWQHPPLNVVAEGSFPKIGNVSLVADILSPDRMRLSLIFVSTGGKYGKNCTISIVLPEGFEFLEGRTSYHGDLREGQQIHLDCLVKAVRDGTWIIRGEAASWHPGDILGIQSCIEVVVVDNAIRAVAPMK